jgi:hypothetical protein
MLENFCSVQIKNGAGWYICRASSGGGNTPTGCRYAEADESSPCKCKFRDGSRGPLYCEDDDCYSRQAREDAREVARDAIDDLEHRDITYSDEVLGGENESEEQNG